MSPNHLEKINSIRVWDIRLMPNELSIAEYLVCEAINEFRMEGESYNEASERALKMEF